jgi:hypothetical protein
MCRYAACRPIFEVCTVQYCAISDVSPSLWNHSWTAKNAVLQRDSATARPTLLCAVVYGFDAKSRARLQWRRWTAGVFACLTRLADPIAHATG